MTDLAGIVLAGGHSSRLGRDKVLLRLRDTEPHLLSRTVTLLRSCVSDVYVSCRRDRLLPSYICIPDEIASIGPMGGIVSALRQLQRPLVVLSCDLPFMDRDTLDHLLAVRAKRSESILMTAWQQSETGYVESLVAIYEPESLPFLEQAREQGTYRLSRAIPEGRRLSLLYSKEDSRPFFNLNYPEELEQALHMAEQS